MANHRMPRTRLTLNRTMGVGLVAGGMALGGVALTMTSAAAPEANAACGSRISAFSNTGTNNPNTFNYGSGNNLNFQGSFTGGNVSSTQTSSTGNNTSTNDTNSTTCTSTQTPSLFPTFPNSNFFGNTGTNNPNTFNVFSGNNVNVQFGGGPNASGAQSATTGNNGSTNTGNTTTSTSTGP